MSFNTDVDNLIPELASYPILPGFTNRCLSALRKRGNPIRVRDLLTRVVGLPYFGHLLLQYFNSQGQNQMQDTTVAERFAVLLLVWVRTSLHYCSSFRGRIIKF